ncbi:hypothetical protein Tco_1236851 [Tanacetum coccineum]
MIWLDHIGGLEGDVEERIDSLKRSMLVEARETYYNLEVTDTFCVSNKGSGVTLEFLDELTLKSSNKGAGVIPDVLDEPSDYYSSSSSNLEFTVEDISSNKADVTEKDDELKKTDDEKAEEEHSEKPEATKVSSSMTLSSAEFTSQFLNNNPDVNVNEVLKDPVEPEVQSMADIHVQQVKLAEQRPPHIDTTITLIPNPTTVSPTQPPPTQQKRSKLERILKKSKRPESQVDVGELDNRVTRLEKKVHAMSSFNLPNPIDKLVKAHLKKVLLADVPNIGKIKMVKAAKKSMPKYSPKPFDQAALDEFDQKDRLFQMMSKSISYNKHPTHKALYDALAVSLMAINDEEPVVDEVVNDGEHPHDDDTPSQDRMLVEKDPLIFDDLIDLEGPTFMLLKGTCGNHIELEYNFEQCHLALSDKLDWTNPEGDRCPFDMSKPLPLQGPPGHLIVPLDFFFNNDLEYLKI